MILARRPPAAVVEAYRQERVDLAPTARPAATPPTGFHREVFRRMIGDGEDGFEQARSGLQAWAAHRGSGVEVFPPDATLEPGATVAILTRQLGLWVLAACRVEWIVDEPSRFGFAYSTLPDHPEQGYESFIVSKVGEEVLFEIEAVSRPGIAIVRIGSPVTRLLQRRATEAYLSALQDRVRTSTS